MTALAFQTQRYTDFITAYLDTADGVKNSKQLRDLQSGKLLSLFQVRLAKALHAKRLEKIEQLASAEVENIVTTLIVDVLEESQFLSGDNRKELESRFLRAIPTGSR